MDNEINVIPPYVSLSFLAITVILTLLFLRRSKQLGCFSFIYVWLIILALSATTLGAFAFMYTGVKQAHFALSNNETYTALTIDTIESGKSDEGETMYQPVVSFTTTSGQVIKKSLGFTTTEHGIEKTYQVKYNEATDEMVTLGFTLWLTLIAPLIFAMVCVPIMIGLILYILGRDMEKFYSFATTFGLAFFVPFMMIIFDALLIYAFFNDNGGMVTTTINGRSSSAFHETRPFWVTALLVFFIVVLSLAIVGYISQCFTKEEPKMKRIGKGKWVGDWSDKKKAKKRRHSPIER